MPKTSTARRAITSCVSVNCSGAISSVAASTSEVLARWPSETIDAMPWAIHPRTHNREYLNRENALATRVFEPIPLSSADSLPAREPGHPS